MRLKRALLAVVVGMTGLLWAAPAAQADGCSNGTVAVLYRKLTGKELVHCP